jgi:hypothetical protein
MRKLYDDEEESWKFMKEIFAAATCVRWKREVGEEKCERNNKKRWRERQTH